jgi:hypothetical protein
MPEVKVFWTFKKDADFFLSQSTFMLHLFSIFSLHLKDFSPART